ncbi:MAG: 3-oxoacyl-[acyl-carrier-protein] reductase [Gemmatimonadetes bacterium]|nr:3-oxoacyl-[acyl-carrier-protein] reductase [Gemmatimonadota bacterium]
MFADLSGRTALVTGGAQGIGRAIALRMAEQGADVVVADVNDEAAERVAREVEARGRRSLAVHMDVSSKESVEAGVARAIEGFGRIDILVNNAGIISDALLMRMKDEDFDRVVNTNLRGTYYCTKAVVPGMLRARWGRIISVSSVVGLRGNAGQANYAASKAGINAFTWSLAKELATRNITVNAIAPGYVATATTEVLSDRVKEMVRRVIPMQRFGTPEEIAGIVVFLASEEAAYITGDVVRVDGGMAI